MRNMSFAKTVQQIKDQSKVVTRRFGWAFLKRGDLVQPVEKCMGLRKGGKMVKIGCPIEIVDVWHCPQIGLSGSFSFGITRAECIKEGFPDIPLLEFVGLLKSMQKEKGTGCTRVEFKYRNDLASSE